ncbi:MAG TPA: hypothetical protein VF322_06830 [Gammaproteobacteria bacterium]
MKGWLKTAAVTAALAIVSMAADAQWPPWPTPNVPRNPDGTPNLEAPTPRTADGHPDFTGIWQRPEGVNGGGAASREDEEPAPQPEGTPPLATFFDIGANIEGGAPYTEWARQVREQRMADDMKDNPDAHCLPMGHMQFHLHPQPRKIIQTPDVMVILYEANGGVRQIFLDGRPPPGPDALPWWYGYSVGHWEGDELVVTTTGLRDDVWLDVLGSPLTSSGKIVERFRRPAFGRMEIDVTIEDPKAYTKPFTVRVNHEIMLDTELIEFVCQENEKSTRHFDP